MRDQVVGYDDDGTPIVESVPDYQQVDLTKLVPLLLNVVQKQQRQIDELRGV
jgi:hypothetical protein